MIERGHEHYFQTVARFPEGDGGYKLQRQCVCGLEERRTFTGDGTPTALSYRYAGLWLEPLDLLRLLPVPVMECPACHGGGLTGLTLDQCETCFGLGITELDGEPITPPQHALR